MRSFITESIRDRLRNDEDVAAPPYGAVDLPEGVHIACWQIRGNWHFQCPDCLRHNIVPDSHAVEHCKFCYNKPNKTEK